LDYRHILRQYWGYDDFRGIQQDIINSIGAGHDTLGLMPTGGGKSITFQVPALAIEGTCIVVTPLISLMKDQVDHLRKLNITAYAIHSGLSRPEIVKILDNCIYGDVKFLYVSPERISSEFFLTKLRHIKVSFITVDEAHCISQWGYDFRPSYLKISEIRRIIPDKAILALTATATPDVVEDIQNQLGFREDKNVFRMSFVRDNLTYIVRETDNKEDEIIHILNSVTGSAIVYTMSRKKTRDISKILNDAGIKASFYHAGLDIAVKTKRQTDWQQGLTRVIVATNAFGMGIDKPDVRLVIHADVPTSIEAYFQEAGRGGRDGKRSYAVLLTDHSTSSTLKKKVSQSFPDPEFIRDIYEHLAYYYQIGVGMGRDHTFLFPLDKFCTIYKFSFILTDAALRILNNAGYIRYNTDADDQTRIMFILSRDELYRLREVPAEEDELILHLMRRYSGLFTAYQYIDLHLLANDMQTTPERIYMLLTNLRQKHILNFVPPRTTPTITYLIDRVDGKDVILSDAVYASLRDVMEKHIQAMTDYIENINECRQRQLIRYFGEQDNCDCGTCEVCIRKRKESSSSDDTQATSFEAISKNLLSILADHKHHKVRDILTTMSVKNEILQKVINHLLAEESIHSDSMSLWI